jgi:YVTN family beta-propeller protein
MFAVNTPDARLSVFDLSQPATPVLIAEIPVGLEPVSVNPRTNDEVWVVNQLSDSVSVVSVSRGIVLHTIRTPDEPADVVFAGINRAFVTASRSNRVLVINTVFRAQISSIPVFGGNPRALAVSSDGLLVYAAFALSGNRTTIVPFAKAPMPPEPTNPFLPPAPQEGIIVDARDPAWSHVVRYTMPDNDVVEINATTLAIDRYFSGVGTVNFGLAIQPNTGNVYVANTNARNLVRFEPHVRGHIVDSRITRIDVATGGVTPFDLNPSIDYSMLPNPAARAVAVSEPTALAFEPNGDALFVAAFGTDRIARVDPDGVVLSRIEIGSATGEMVDPANKRGPRGLAFHNASGYLYVLNRISNTISIVDTARDTAVAELPVGSYDPTPAVIRRGRGFLYDAKLSGNGTASCASCHVDADMDMLAWDLGDPGGSLQTVVTSTGTFELHPMKGPMTTQTLRGLSTLEPFHWRGDRENFLAFNHAFDTLMGGTDLAAADMAAFRDFINTIRFHPNPNQKLDRTLPTWLAGGSPVIGRESFLNEDYTTRRSGFACAACHTTPGPGSNRTLTPKIDLMSRQDTKVPHLRNLYQKTNFNNRTGAASIDGFGFAHNGEFATIFDFLGIPPFDLVRFDGIRKRHLAAFLLTFDTGTAPAVGFAKTITPANWWTLGVSNDVVLLQNQAALGNVDVIAKGTISGRPAGLLYRPVSNDYVTDKAGQGPFTLPQLLAMVVAGDTMTGMGVPPGSGVRLGIDRDLDGILDGDELGAAAR